MVVRDPAAEERAVKKRKKTAKRRADYFTQAVLNARNGREQLQHACQYARAVGDDADEAIRRELAAGIAALADERNRT